MAWTRCDDAHRHQKSVISRSKQTREMCRAPGQDVERRISWVWATKVLLYGARDAAANWEDAYAKTLQEHQFERGVACLCSFCSGDREIRLVVHGDDFLTGGPKHRIMNKHFQSKHITMGASCDFDKSLVMLNKKDCLA